MINIRFIAADQTTHDIQASPGQSLMQAAVDGGVQGIEADCGGTLSCGTCHVKVTQPWLDRLAKPDAQEMEMLAFTAEAAEPHSRLSCQIPLTPELNGLVVQLPATQH